MPIAIVGAGFAGIGLAIKLREAGIHDFTILERADELGGTWRDNTYPGCACDVASNLYSYSFAPNPDWSRAFSRQEEILSYLRAVAEEHDVERDVRYDTELIDARWDEDASRWSLQTRRRASSRPTCSCRPPARSATRSCPTCPGSTASRGPSSTRSAGTTTTTSRANGSR